MTPLLELDGVDAGYGPFRALFDVSLAIGSGRAVALVGPNGAGKTTVARVASGLVRPAAGRVAVDGHDLAGRRPEEFALAGISHAPEGRSVFATLTVEENLALSLGRLRGRRGIRSGLDETFDRFPKLRERRRQRAGTLSGGEQRMLAMARVLLEAPKVLIADELSLGLAPPIIRQVYEMLATFRESGTSLLIIEQHVSHALDLCDEVVALDHGSVRWAGAATEARSRVREHLAFGEG